MGLAKYNLLPARENKKGTAVVMVGIKIREKIFLRIRSLSVGI
jgi:hypothetical protein